MNEFSHAAEQLMQRCEVLAAISQADYVDRRYLSAEHRKANDQVSTWLSQAGCQTWEDGAANLWGRYASDKPDAPRLIMGSHLDTVPNGGKYDGMLGVLAPIAVVAHLNEQQIRLPFHIDIVGFGDEEGTRFGSTLLGSRALTGQWQDEWAQLTDKDGISLEQAMADFGLDFHGIKHSALNDTQNILAYVELHIEQGPVLEQQNLPVGVVTAINGARRFWFDVIGSAGHAGTVPMNLRKDALSASAQMILAIEEIAKKYAVVATVGAIENSPNGVNVIAGDTRFSLDIRSEDNELRDAAFAAIVKECELIAIARQVNFRYTQTHNASAVACSNSYQRLLSQAITKAELSPFSLSSGAGHDAMAMAEICQVAMLFMRCDKGISHHPAEAINSGDVQIALKVLHQFILLLSEQVYCETK